jgi:hypothetical protein
VGHIGVAPGIIPPRYHSFISAQVLRFHVRSGLCPFRGNGWLFPSSCLCAFCCLFSSCLLCLLRIHSVHSENSLRFLARFDSQVRNIQQPLRFLHGWCYFPSGIKIVNLNQWTESEERANQVGGCPVTLVPRISSHRFTLITVRFICKFPIFWGLVLHSMDFQRRLHTLSGLTTFSSFRTRPIIHAHLPLFNFWTYLRLSSSCDFASVQIQFDSPFPPPTYF